MAFKCIGMFDAMALIRTTFSFFFFFFLSSFSIVCLEIGFEFVMLAQSKARHDVCVHSVRF